MSEDPEPAVNIGAGTSGGEETTTVGTDDPATRAEAVVDRLGELYWQKSYGGQDAFACLVRTVLSQNTSDAASQPAHDDLLARYGGSDGADLAASLAEADRDDVAAVVRPAGLHNRKADRIVTLATRVVAEFDGAAGFDAFVGDGDPAAVRERLMTMDGVGPKTADCVLLFAGGRDGVFPVDTHVHRIARRIGVAPADADHEVVRAALKAAVPAERCGFGHTAMIQLGREHCSARAPACLDDPEACPMADLCDAVGVDPATGEVVDPAEAAGAGGSAGD